MLHRISVNNLRNYTADGGISMSAVKKVLGFTGVAGVAAGAFLAGKYYQNKVTREKIAKALGRVKKIKLLRKKKS